jgi:NAD(P)-dependent dehydrogenase (short-subunit alcohol dehydrogenase family)
VRVIVTGCSSGIGLATALMLGRRGDAVVAGVRNVDRSGELGSAVVAEDLDVTITQLDVNDLVSVHGAVDAAIETMKGIDALVNNAGVSQLSAIEDLRDADARALMETNYLGPLRMCRAVIPTMRAQGRGRIVNVSSMNAQATFAYAGGYGASKAAMEAMSEALALEVADVGISVAIMQPGVFDTAIDRNSLPRADSQHYQGEADRLDAGRSDVAAAAPPVDEAARAIVDLLDHPDPPLRTPVGRDAAGILKRRRAMTDADFFAWVRSMDQRPRSEPTDHTTDNGA